MKLVSQVWTDIAISNGVGATRAVLKFYFQRQTFAFKKILLKPWTVFLLVKTLCKVYSSVGLWMPSRLVAVNYVCEIYSK